MPVRNISKKYISLTGQLKRHVFSLSFPFKRYLHALLEQKQKRRAHHKEVLKNPVRSEAQILADATKEVLIYLILLTELLLTVLIFDISY
jgi:hypothetical protein